MFVCGDICEFTTEIYWRFVHSLVYLCYGKLKCSIVISAPTSILQNCILVQVYVNLRCSTLLLSCGQKWLILSVTQLCSSEVWMILKRFKSSVGKAKAKENLHNPCPSLFLLPYFAILLMVVYHSSFLEGYNPLAYIAELHVWV